MSQKTKIEWTESTWNPVSGCDKISDGCKNCYAEKMAKRLQAMGTKGYENGFKVTLHPDRLSEPTKRKKPTMYFVCSMGDLFHDDVPFWYIDDIFATMIHNSQHTFQVLTKRPKRMQQYFMRSKELIEEYFPNGVTLPAQNIWLGVTAENQEQADNRIPILLDIPATKRFVSIEPMLSKIDFERLYSRESYLFDLDWVICGGETGANARPLHPDWVRNLRDQCQESNVPFFFKQWGEYISTVPASYKEEPSIWMNIDGKTATEEEALKGGSWKGFFKVGKKQAGHLIDDVEHRNMPINITNKG